MKTIGGIAADNVAVAALAFEPVLVCNADTGITLSNVPTPPTVTFTPTVHVPPAGIVELAASSVTLCAADDTAPPHVVAAIGGVAMSMPGGSESVSAAVRFESTAALLASVIVSRLG